jgi:Glycosyltransferase family 87
VNHPASQSGRPPLWLAAAAVAAGWGAIYDIGRWMGAYVTFPAHEDVRIYYVAAQAGLRYGWSTIYDIPTLRALSVGFAGGQTNIDSSATYISPPPLAWLFAPLTALSEPAAYAVWAAFSLGAFLLMARVSVPYRGLARATLLWLALALWPVLDAFYRGQPVLVLLALVAASWWLTSNDRPWAAGIALAFATALKPQVVYLVPLALLVSGRYRVVLGWAAACAVLAIAFVVSLGQSGVQSWWQTFQLVETNGEHAYFTLAYLFGFGALTYSLLAILGIAALAVAWKRRDELEMVFATGLLGSLAVSVHLHLYDYTTLVLAAWLVLRTAPPLWHRLWLLAGVITMQALALGFPVPQLLWDAGWLGILVVSSFVGSGASGPATRPAISSGARGGT